MPLRSMGDDLSQLRTSPLHNAVRNSVNQTAMRSKHEVIQDYAYLRQKRRCVMPLGLTTDSR